MKFRAQLKIPVSDDETTRRKRRRLLLDALGGPAAVARELRRQAQYAQSRIIEVK
jgi:hypothetical protein